jgi:hypothetical protein
VSSDPDLVSMLTQEGTITRRSQTGAADPENYGAPAWVETISTHPCYYEPGAGTENTAGVEVAVGDAFIVFDAGVTIGVLDLVEVLGVTHEVVEPPRRIWDPTVGAEHHVEAMLRFVPTEGQGS